MMAPDASPDSESPVVLVEFPSDDPDRAKGFWSHVLGVSLEDRTEAEGRGWQTRGGGPALGLHERGTGPGDRFSLAYFAVEDLPAALDRVRSAERRDNASNKTPFRYLQPSGRGGGSGSTVVSQAA